MNAAATSGSLLQGNRAAGPQSIGFGVSLFGVEFVRHISLDNFLEFVSSPYRNHNRLAP
jgi:hypothetical protein